MWLSVEKQGSSNRPISHRTTCRKRAMAAKTAARDLHHAADEAVNQSQPHTVLVCVEEYRWGGGGRGCGCGCGVLSNAL